MQLIINEKTYEVEYSFEAATYDDCITKLFDYVGATTDGFIAERSGSIFNTLVGTPKLVITLFYAGLLEKNPVKDENEAKELLKQYFKENTDMNFGEMFKKICEQMEKDGFFKLIGLETAVTDLTNAIKAQGNKIKKIPTDHKRKVLQK